MKLLISFALLACPSSASVPAKSAVYKEPCAATMFDYTVTVCMGWHVLLSARNLSQHECVGRIISASQMECNMWTTVGGQKNRRGYSGVDYRASSSNSADFFFAPMVRHLIGSVCRYITAVSIEASVDVINFKCRLSHDNLRVVVEESTDACEAKPGGTHHMTTENSSIAGRAEAAT